MTRHWRSRWASGCTAVLGVLLSNSVAGAASSQAVEAGKQLFMKNCATCHGRDATGDGPLAASLKTKPANLTLLSKRHDGKFPYMDVLDILDNGLPAAAHGSAEMPVWGQVFQYDEIGASGSPMDQAAARGRLMLLTDYLRSIQTK